MATYRSVVCPARGTTDVLTIVENELRDPAAGEARIRVLAASVTQDDVAARVGNRPTLPKLPFVPGYSIIGAVDAVGEGVTSVAPGDRVGALTQTGGYTEVITLDAATLVAVPEGLDPAEAMPLLLNYLVAYQAMHRVAKVKPGDKILIIGASGGCGTAFLDLGRLAGLTMYGVASAAKADAVRALGATPIDYRTEDYVEVLHRLEPEGVDTVFNGMAEDQFGRGLAVLRRGGAFVHYGGPESMWGLIVLIAKFAALNVLPNGKRVKGYGTHTVDIEVLKEDWRTLFKLLETGQIHPVIAGRYPILEAAAANDCLEDGGVVGNLVLLAPELLRG
jgi:NADPH:quinone reductase-like Zn-dependent oxidoreductase